MGTETAIITREKVYRRQGLFAWQWHYTVTVTSEPFSFAQGPNLANCLSWLKRRFPDTSVVKVWESERQLENPLKS